MPPAGMVCSPAGTQARSKTENLCNSAGACQAATPTSETAACSRAVEGTNCGAATFGAWSTCSFASPCAINGTRTRMKTEPLCQSGSCQSVVSTETDTTGCPRPTEGINCGPVTFGGYGACGYANACIGTGSRSRVRTEPKCSSGACVDTTSTDTDTAGCARNQDGTTCAAPTIGAYTACSYGATCSNGGTRTRQVTSFACGAGVCGSSTVTETDSAGCARNTNGTTCGTSTVDPGTCSYGAGICTNAGSRVETTTSYACNAGSCASSVGSATLGCTRNTDGTVCMTRTCTTCRSCFPDCIRERDCTDFTCSAGSCGQATTTEICGSCPPTCVPI